jgi:heme exporter protein A
MRSSAIGLKRRCANWCGDKRTALESEPTTSRLGVAFLSVEKRYGSLAALRGVTLEIGAGEFVALLGPNGAGKTTLLKMAAVLVQPSSGKVEYPERAGATRESIKRSIGMVAHSTMLYDEMSAAENLLFFARLYDLDQPERRATAALQACGLPDRAADLVRTFSRGMRQRLAIARALIHSPSLLLLDEATAGLDRQGIAWLADTLAERHRAGCTILMSTHGRNDSIGCVTRAVMLSGGRVQADSGAGGDPRSMLSAVPVEG